MTPAPPRSRSPLRGLLLLAAALAAGCADDPHTPVDAAALARMAKEGEAGLRAFGEGRFEVLDFHPGKGARVDFSDPFHFHTRLYAVELTARIRFSRRLEVPSKSAIEAAIRAPGWTPEAGEAALALHEVLGEGPREAGAVETLHAAAIFDDLEPGLRFDRIDHPR